MEIAKPTYPISFSLNFPETLPNEIIKENIISGIAKQFENGKQLICIDADEGMGKTTILKQFAEKKPQVCLASFINPVRGVLAPEDFVLHDLFDQLTWYATTEIRNSNSNIDIEKYANILFLVKREQKRRKETLYFILDGLEFVTDEITLQKIVKLLPIADPGIKILLSGDSEKIKQIISNSTVAFHQLTLFAFTLDEAEKVFNSNKYTKDELKQIWLSANEGQPGKLQEIFRLLSEQSLSVEDFLNDLDQLSILYEVDWRKLNAINDQLLNKVVAFIALDDKVYTLNGLAKLFDCEETPIVSSIQKISFLVIRANKEIQFTSNSSRQFFAKKLADYKKTVISENIKYLLKNQDTLEALTSLPKYYSSSSDYDGLINLLSTNYFPKLIKASQTLTSVTNSVNLGYLAAKKSGADQKLFDFSLYGSLIQNIEGLHIWDSEIDARIEIGDYDKAIQLANSALLQEDKLKFLTRIAKIKKKKNEIIEEALTDQINKLFRVVDLKSLGDRSIHIAADLFYVNPSLAIKLIQDTSLKQNQNINEWLLTKLTLSAIESKENVDGLNVSELLTSHKTREFISVISNLFGKYSLEEILREVSKLNEAKEKILLIRLWITHNNKELNISKAINFALDELLNNNSKDFSEPSLLSDLIKPLKHLKDKKQIDLILDKVLKFKDESKKLGYTVDYYRFIINAIEGKLISNVDFAIGWFNDLKNDLDKIEDKTIKGECLALLVNCLYDIEPNLDKGRHGYLFEMLKSQLKNLVLEIFDTSAFHYENLKDIIYLLAKHNCEFAVEMALKANTTTRRDLLLFKVFEGYVSANIKKLKAQRIESINSKISDNFVKEGCLKCLLEEIIDEKDLSVHERIVGYIVKNLSNVQSLTTQSYLVCLTILCLHKEKEKHSKLINNLYNQLSKNWSGLDSEVLKIEIGFQIACTLCDVDKEIANEYLRRADLMKKTIWADSINTINIYGVYARLLIKSFSGLIKRKLYDEAKFRKLIEVISAIPDPLPRIRLWAYLSSIAHIKEDLNLREKIFNEFIKPTFDACSDEHNKRLILVQLSYLFFLNNQIAALNRIELLPKAMKEEALETIIAFLLYHKIPDEPYDSSDKSFKEKLSYDDINSVCELIEKLEIDQSIFSSIANVVDASIPIKLTPIQKDSLKQKLTTIVTNKLPNKEYIQHNGYKIISLAYILKLEKDSKLISQKFEGLLADLESSVKNQSDKGFVYATLSEVIPSLKGVKHSQIGFINKALTAIEGLYLKMEEINRIEGFSSVLHNINPNLWKEKLGQTFKQSLHSGNYQNSIAVQRRIIDKAYKHDPQFAKSLVNLLDDEEVRIEYRKKQSLMNFYETLYLKKQIIEDNLAGKKWHDQNFSQACYRALGSLNSTKIGSKKPNQMRYYFDHSIKLPVTEAFPIYSYYVENLVRKYEETQEAQSTFIPLIDSLYGVCKVLEVIVEKFKTDISTVDTRIDLSNARKKIYKAGERDIAFAYLKNWIEENNPKYIKICDPYFGIEDLDFIKVILEVSKQSRIYILTSVDGNGNRSDNIYEKYLLYWNSISEQDPPYTKVAIVKIKRTNLSPIHDRWILLDKSALHLGTSLSGIGISKVSQVTELAEDERITVEKDIFDELFDGQKIEFNGERIECLSFTLV